MSDVHGAARTEPPPTYLFAVALTVLLAIMLCFATAAWIGVWVGEVVVVVLIRIACLVGIGFGIRQLLMMQARAVVTLGFAFVVMWLSVLIEGGIMWGDVLWFLGKVTGEPQYGALLAALILSIAVVVLLLVRPTRQLLK